MFTVILEKLAEIDQADAFLEAIDSDDLAEASRLMKRAGIDSETRAMVLKMIADGDE